MGMALGPPKLSRVIFVTQDVSGSLTFTMTLSIPEHPCSRTVCSQKQEVLTHVTTCTDLGDPLREQLTPALIDRAVLVHMAMDARDEASRSYQSQLRMTRTACLQKLSW